MSYRQAVSRKSHYLFPIHPMNPFQCSDAQALQAYAASITKCEHVVGGVRCSKKATKKIVHMNVPAIATGLPVTEATASYCKKHAEYFVNQA